MESKRKKTMITAKQLHPLIPTESDKKEADADKNSLFSPQDPQLGLWKWSFIIDVNGYLGKEVCQFSFDMYQVILPR